VFVGFGLFHICAQLPFSPHSKNHVLQRGPSTNHHQNRPILWVWHRGIVALCSSCTYDSDSFTLPFLIILKHERALKLWRTGNAPTKDTKTSFVRRPWAVRTATHHKVIVKLSERVWGEIHDASSLAIGSVDVDATADDSEIEDPEDLVQLSSE
jgi:hypothetical protein